ncbi:MAG: ester cyclase [Chitinophagaceae bacterium]|nr:ester cyclase [Chitinophagaceae bacterium]
MNTLEKNKQIVRQFYEDGWNNRNFEIVRQTHAENWSHHDNSNPNDIGGGPEGNINRMKELVQSFPDLKFTIEEMVAEDDKVVIRFAASGTQKGQFGPLPPTDKQVKMLGYITHRIENGQIIEDWVVRDTYGLMMQLGVINTGKNRE